MTDMMVEVLKERGLREVFAMKTSIGDGTDPSNWDRVPTTRLAFYDPITRMFFTRTEGHPIANNPEDSARNTIGIVDSRSDLTGSLGRNIRVLDLARTGRVGLEARAVDEQDARVDRWPEYRREHGFVWCAIAAQESRRYTHLAGLAIYWDADVACVVDHDWLWDTHQKVHVDPHGSGSAVTLLGRPAPKDILATEFRGGSGLPSLRLFYAGLGQID